MSGADLQELEEVRGLIARGVQTGVRTFAEIATATAELGLEDTDVEELQCVFERCKIELIEEIDPAAAANLIVERAPEKRTRRKAALNLEAEPTTDGLQLFLKGIGKVRLLTAREEVDLAQRIERGRSFVPGSRQGRRCAARCARPCRAALDRTATASPAGNQSPAAAQSHRKEASGPA